MDNALPRDRIFGLLLQLDEYGGLLSATQAEVAELHRLGYTDSKRWGDIRLTELGREFLRGNH